MKALPILVASLLLLVPACGDKAKAAVNEAGNAAQIAEAAKNLTAAKTTFGDLTKALAGITDSATADKAKASLTGLVDTLKTQLGSVGGFSKIAEGLGATATKTINDQIAKLTGNADIAKSIGPVLEQLKGLLAGK